MDESKKTIAIRATRTAHGIAIDAEPAEMLGRLLEGVAQEGTSTFALHAKSWGRALRQALEQSPPAA